MTAEPHCHVLISSQCALNDAFFMYKELNYNFMSILIWGAIIQNFVDRPARFPRKAEINKKKESKNKETGMGQTKLNAHKYV